MSCQKKTLGIIGGMGPAATAMLFESIISNTQANCDAEHIHILIDNYPQIPDRTTAILSGSNEPVKYICEAGQRLINMGAELILIPCNTSHYYFEEIKNNLSVPVINMIEETALYCRRMGCSVVGVLATDGTRKTDIYKTEFEKAGLDVVYPSEEGQKQVMSVIYEQVKAGKEINTSGLEAHLKDMEAQGAQAFVLGCTELPIAIKDGDFGFRFIDTIEVLAKSAILKAGYNIKK